MTRHIGAELLVSGIYFVPKKFFPFYHPFPQSARLLANFIRQVFHHVVRGNDTIFISWLDPMTVISAQARACNENKNPPVSHRAQVGFVLRQQLTLRA